MSVRFLAVALATLAILVLLAPPTTAQAGDGWAAHQRRGGYPGECTEPVQVVTVDAERVDQHCFGAYKDTAPGETLFFQGQGFQRGTEVTMRVRGPSGETLAEKSDTLGANSSPGELPQYWQPSLAWRVPRDSPPGDYAGEVEWSGGKLSYAFRVHDAPRIFTTFGGAPARGEGALLQGVGFEAGPFEMTVVQGDHRWRGLYRVEGANETSTLSMLEVSVPGASAPALALSAGMSYGTVQAVFTVVAADEEDVSVWMNGTRGGAPASATLTFRPQAGGPRAWARVEPLASPEGTVMIPTHVPCPGQGGGVAFVVHAYAVGQEGPVEARVLDESGAVLGRATGAPVDGFVEVGVEIRNATVGSYVAAVGDERARFQLGANDAPQCRAPGQAGGSGNTVPLGSGIAPLALAVAGVATARRLRPKQK